MNTFHRLARLSSVFALLLCPALTFGQSPDPRIRGPIELTPSVPLEGSLNPHIRLSDDLGPLAPDTRISGITLVFKRSATQEADLQQLLAQQIDLTSPLYHHWLTPDDFAARFGIADADIAAAESWLQSHGFTIDSVARSRDRISFSGTAAQIQQAFGTELHHYRFSSNTEPELHFAPASELLLPPALAPLTAAVLHLSDFRPKPNFRPIPHYTTATSQSHFLAPADVATMYDLGPILTSFNTSPGTGQSIAVVGQSYVPTANGSAVYNFNLMVGGNNTNIFPVLMPGTGNEAAYPGEEGEADIDLEYSSSTATRATVYYVFTGSSPNHNVFDALAFAISQDLAPVISVSYGGCEPLMSSSDLQQYNLILQQAAAQGQTVVVASGDSGPSACAGYTSGVTQTQQQALAVSFPASSPYATAVGGTQMASGTFAAGPNQYWTSASTADVSRSLLSYVPEVVWNEDSTSLGLAASGGGASVIFPRPAWQTGVPGIPSGSYRLLPDVALQASLTSPGYLICTEDRALTGGASDCLGGTPQNSNNKFVIAGGTSFAAPIFAGFVAILNQYEHTLGQGNINPTLYALAAQPSIYSSAFHDITSGTIACAIGDGNCGGPGTSGFVATAGYDMATGLGSLDFKNLATAWPSGSPSNRTPTSTFFSYTQLTANAGATVPVQILVSTGYIPGGPTLPTGTLSISLDGQTVNPSLALGSDPNNQGSASYSFVAPSQTGSHILMARYSGDATHLPSSSAYIITVGNVLATGSVALSASNLTIANNGSGTTPVTITPSDGYSGALTWSASASGGNGTQTLCYIVRSPAISGPATATVYFAAGTACSSSPGGSIAPSNVQRTSLQPPSAPLTHHAPAAATFVAVLLCGILPSSRRRRLLPLLSALVLAALSIPLSGCGGGSSSGTGVGNGNGTTAPQPQVYTITLKAQDSVNFNITASASFTLTVNN